MLSNNIMDYYVVSQGKTTIPNVDDGEECELTDVRQLKNSMKNWLSCKTQIETSIDWSIIFFSLFAFIETVQVEPKHLSIALIFCSIQKTLTNYRQRQKSRKRNTF
jgi:hypothetical protein